jgi:hypothetical protein
MFLYVIVFEQALYRVACGNESHVGGGEQPEEQGAQLPLHVPESLLLQLLDQGQQPVAHIGPENTVHTYSYM